MTRKHYVAIARALQFAKPKVNDPKYYAWKTLVSEMVSICAADNPRFNSDKFRAACGIGQ